MGILLIFQGCLVTYGDNTGSQYSIIQHQECSVKSSSFYTFYLGENLDFSYVKIGEVETEGDKYDSNSKILDHLKYNAWKNCGNALINITSDYKERTKGTLFNSDSEEIYTSKYYKAIAVKIETDSLFLAKYGNGDPTHFRENVTVDKEEEVNRASNQFMGSIFLGLVVVLAVIIGVTTSK